MSLTALAEAWDFREHYEQKVAEAAEFIRNSIAAQPVFGIVLGSGLGDLAGEIKHAETIPYADIPHFPIPTVKGHEGNLLIGKLEEVPVIGLQGRKHFYEIGEGLFGTGMLQVVFPVHVLANLGVKNYFATNAVGALNTSFAIGDIMVIESHINAIKNPLLGKHYAFKTVSGRKTVRFQNMADAYNPTLSSLLFRSAKEVNKDKVHIGTYLAVTGPSYETSAECRTFRKDADSVGMSIAPEVIVARNRGIKVVAFSCITNTIGEDGKNKASHKEVTAVLNKPETRARLAETVCMFFREYRRQYL